MSDSQMFATLLRLRDKIEQSRDIAKHHVEEHERQLRAINTTIELLRTDGFSPELAEISKTEDLIKELKGKTTQLAALIVIARKNNGVLRTVEAKELLQRSGLMKPTKNAANILYNVIMRSERFEHVSPGTYRLKPGIVPIDSPQVPSSEPAAAGPVRTTGTLPLKPFQ
jgi:hypothetical protein